MCTDLQNPLPVGSICCKSQSTNQQINMYLKTRQGLGCFYPFFFQKKNFKSTWGLSKGLYSAVMPRAETAAVLTDVWLFLLTRELCESVMTLGTIKRKKCYSADFYPSKTVFREKRGNNTNAPWALMSTYARGLVIWSWETASCCDSIERWVT